MSPYQHGEVFVTDDGAETDLDLGHYERFIDESLDVNSSVSSGKVYWDVLNRERRGGTIWGPRCRSSPTSPGRSSGGSTPWTPPAPTWPLWRSAAPWGTSSPSPFWSPSARWRRSGGGTTSCSSTSPSSYPSPGTGELKSKPTQHSAKELLSLGIQPDVIMCRSDKPIPRDILEKISLFCNIPRGERHPQPDGGSALRGAPDAGAGGAGGRGGPPPGAHLPHAGPHRVGHHGPPGQAPQGGCDHRPWWANMWPSTTPISPWQRP